MTPAGCARFAELVNALECGATLSAADHVFLAEHTGDCPDCAGRVAGGASLGGVTSALAVDAGPNGPDELAAVEDNGVARPRPPEPSDGDDGGRAAGAPWLHWLALAAGALLLLVGILAYRASRRADPGVRLRITAADGSGASSSLDAQIAAGAELVAGSGRLCGRLDPGVDLCLAPAGAARVEPSVGADHRVTLLRGRLVAALGALPPGERFAVGTPLGEVTALGTVFSVSLVDDDVVVAVLEGRVAAPGERKVIEGERLSLSRGVVAPIDRAERASVSVLLGGVAPPLSQPVAPLGRELGAVGPEPRPPPSGSSSAAPPAPPSAWTSPAIPP